MKKLIKMILQEADYLLYLSGVKKNYIKVCSIDQTIDELLMTNKSMVRFGDGEIVVIRGHDLKLQRSTPEIAEGLKPILAYTYDDLIVAIPEIFGNLNIYVPRSKAFWKEHLFFNRKIYYQYCNMNKMYYNAFIGEAETLFSM